MLDKIKIHLYIEWHFNMIKKKKKKQLPAFNLFVVLINLYTPFHLDLKCFATFYMPQLASSPQLILINLFDMHVFQVHDFSFERRSKFGNFYFSQSTKYISLSLRRLRMHFLKEKNHLFDQNFRLQLNCFSYVLSATRKSVQEICILLCKCIPSVKN